MAKALLSQVSTPGLVGEGERVSEGGVLLGVSQEAPLRKDESATDDYPVYLWSWLAAHVTVNIKLTKSRCISSDCERKHKQDRQTDQS